MVLVTTYIFDIKVFELPQGSELQHRFQRLLLVVVMVFTTMLLVIPE
jgi:hypothetical protein